MKTRRIVLIVFVMVVLFGATASAQSKWSSFYMPGNTAFGVDAAAGFQSGGLAIELYPTAELLIHKARFLDIVPLDFGVGARGLVSLSPSFGGMSVGAGAYGSMHVGFRGISTFLSEYLGRVDVYLRLGLGYQLFLDQTFSDRNGLQFISDNGFSYFITDNLALSLTYKASAPLFNNAWAGWSSTGIGVTLKLGEPEPLYEGESWIGEMGRAIETGLANIAVIQFSSLYWAFFGMGGFVISDQGYDVGEATRWRTTFEEDGERDEMILERALLHEAADGSRWWRTAFEIDGEEIAYEFHVDPEFRLLELRYQDDAGSVVTYTPEDEDDWWIAGGYETLEQDEFVEMSVGSERVTVPAGRFEAERLEYQVTETDSELVWWVTDEVPGLLVKFEGHGEDYESISGELIEILTGVDTPWGRAW